MIDNAAAKLSALLGMVGPISLIVALLVMALLSQRLGAVTKRARSYRWFFVSIGLIVVSISIRVLTLGAPPDQLTELEYNVPMAVALTLAVVVGWRYWGWLLSERQVGPDGKTQH